MHILLHTYYIHVKCICQGSWGELIYIYRYTYIHIYTHSCSASAKVVGERWQRVQPAPPTTLKNGHILAASIYEALTSLSTSCMVTWSLCPKVLNLLSVSLQTVPCPSTYLLISTPWGSKQLQAGHIHILGYFGRSLRGLADPGL